MKKTQYDFLNSIRSKQENLSQYQLEYWESFSSLGTWQFWIIMLFLILPLIILFIFIDKNKALLLGFFGLNYHIWFTYVNFIGTDLALWEYPYQVFPFIPGFALDASLVPVSFMLLYQWTLNQNKSIYLYSVLLSALLAFILKPIMVNFHFFHMYNGINYFHLFLFYLAFFIFSKLITNVFLWLRKKGKQDNVEE
ncbi:hypothetical protein J2R98_001664 [Alkalibacillus filiformis]|uniref:Permease n=1 Tax=Alkalibacillus filiformis TaxID=200990 RepID=A0ABU0DTP1_9BACI|nr:CBO0543 family protein [Alkalibacillus filiformis]MDQ0351832.1 hypothetical protein [Alkalibacillus filiformis]